MAIEMNDYTEVRPLKKPREDLTPEERLLIPAIDPAYLMPKWLSVMIATDIGEGIKVCLTGHMGTGKSSMFMQIAASVSAPVIRVNLNQQTTYADLVGFWSVKAGETVWVDGALTIAMRRGYWIILDEVDRAEANTLSAVNAVAEPGGKLMLKEKGCEIVVPHPKFRLLCTGNTIGVMEEFRHLYQGANQMDQSLIDRFRVYKVDYLPEHLEVKVLMKTVQGCPQEAADVLVRFANDIRSAFNEELLDKPFSLRALIDLARMMARMRNTEAKKGAGETKKGPNEIILDAISTCIFPKISRKDATVMEDIIGKITTEETA